MVSAPAVALTQGASKTIKTLEVPNLEVKVQNSLKFDLEFTKKND